MIIFYHKDTGEIVGTVLGKNHTVEEKKMWIGDRKEIRRKIIEWKPTSWRKEKDGSRFATEFSPDCDEETKKIVNEVEKNPSLIHSNYKIDVSSGIMKEKSKEEKNEDSKKLDELRKISEKRRKMMNEAINVVLDEEKAMEERFNNLLVVLDIKTHKNV